MKSITSKGPVARAFDHEDGRLTQVAFLNGYQFGDRLLEGVMFRCELLPDQRLRITVTDKCQKYFKTLNQDHWLKAALAYAAGTDIFSEKENGGEDLAFVDPEDHPSDQGEIDNGKTRTKAEPAGR